MTGVITVSQLNNFIRQIISAEEYLQYITVSGEVFSISVVNNNAFITLADKDAQIACTQFGVNPQNLPKKGDRVLVTGGLSYYAKSGKMTFIARKTELAGSGVLLQKFDELKKKLQAEGLFDENRKKTIPKYAKKIVVVTSVSGAVIRDIVTTVRRKNPVIDISVIDARVQGETAYTDIINGLDFADELNADAVILARGGGSLEDLLPFFDERVVRKVASMKTPLISAIGHETNFSLCDFAADLRAPTPTAAGEAVAYDYYETIDTINRFVNKISAHFQREINAKSQNLNHLINSILLKSYNKIDADLSKVKNIVNVCNYALNNKILIFSHVFDKTIDLINANNPMNMIKKGLYKIERNNTPLASLKNIKANDLISIFSCEGKATATIKSVELKKEL